ncbi:hypothetical protein HPB58_07920 [Priestia filamentosa]|nr:hypothetical protein [Priestia filamentosa]MED3725993.1 hypothetical protein [Priestia filamentosa]UOE62086.1 hypothetical protein HPB58_07920 [Priestia filamentosa]
MKRTHFKKFFIASPAACCFFCMSEITKDQSFIDGEAKKSLCHKIDST